MCGCSTRQPVEAWQKNVDSIFEVVTNGDTFFFFSSFSEHLFLVTVSSTILFTEFMRFSTEVGEASS
jgi:hypothetical protein